MKVTKLINLNSNLVAANSFLKNAITYAGELNKFKGKLVRLKDRKGKITEGFFMCVEFIIDGNQLVAKYVISNILECNGVIMGSEHMDYIYDAIEISTFTFRNYKYDIF